MVRLTTVVSTEFLSSCAKTRQSSPFLHDGSPLLQTSGNSPKRERSLPASFQVRLTRRKMAEQKMIVALEALQDRVLHSALPQISRIPNVPVRDRSMLTLYPTPPFPLEFHRPQSDCEQADECSYQQDAWQTPRQAHAPHPEEEQAPAAQYEEQQRCPGVRSISAGISIIVDGHDRVHHDAVMPIEIPADPDEISTKETETDWQKQPVFPKNGAHTVFPLISHDQVFLQLPGELDGILSWLIDGWFVSADEEGRDVQPDALPCRQLPDLC
jgi:hypothetical protein